MATYTWGNGNYSPDINIIKASNGYIINFKGQLLVARTLKEATKLILKHFSEEDE